MYLHRAIAPLLLSLAAGCVSVPSPAKQMTFQTGAKLFPLDSPPGGVTPPQTMTFPSLAAAAYEVTQNEPPGGHVSMFTTAMERSNVVRKLVSNSLAAVEQDAPGGTLAATPEEFTKHDVIELLADVLPNVGVGLDAAIADSTAPTADDAPGAVATRSRYDRSSKTLKRFQRYFIAYSRGEFVNRQGDTIATPKVTKKGIPNDTITGVEALLMEAVFDELFPVPVWRNGEKWLTPNGKRPTVSIFDENAVVDLATAGTHAVTQAEVRAIMFASQVAGQQSRLISGLVFRLFGDVELSFVIGGDFAVGDNETLAAAVDTFFEVGSRRTAEARACKYFTEHDTNDEALQEFLDMLTEAYKLIDKALEAEKTKE